MLRQNISKIIEGHNTFALDLYAQLARIDKVNLFFSPHSIYTALCMTYLGARGKTAQEMADVLCMDLNPEQITVLSEGIIQRLKNPQLVVLEENVGGELREKKVSAYQLCVANALWAGREFPFREDYISLVRKRFYAELMELDFVSDPESGRQIINGWIESKTNQKIKEFLPPGIIQNDTRLILTNAIYFMSNWAKTFEKQMTKDLSFTLIDKTKVKCPQMFQKDRFGYMETETFQGLYLPYKGHDLEMVIFLPKNANGLPELENKINIKNLNEWMGKFKHHKVEVTLPKFEFSYSINLGGVLQAMGMKQAFTWPGADFSGMTTNPELVISIVLHKAFLAVDEEGTEAVAATAVIMPVGASPMRFRKEIKPKIFKADRPFLFIIRHQKTGAVIFMGRLLNPIG